MAIVKIANGKEKKQKRICMSDERTNRGAYTYIGPEALHSHIGQVMAYLGFHKKSGDEDVGASLFIREEGDSLFVKATFGVYGDIRAYEATIQEEAAVREALKKHLIHWCEDAFQLPKSPWGTLIGVRPTKLVHGLLDSHDERDVAHILKERYEVEPAVAEKLVTMANIQRPYVTLPKKTVALYIGIPYCPSHCLYCSFPSRLIGKETPSGLEAFSRSLVADIHDVYKLCQEYGLTVDSAYIGGGTPTCLPKEFLEPILREVAVSFPDLKEWTVEAGRPDTTTVDMLSLLRQYGVDRISCNPQTMQDRLLQALGRRHSVGDIYAMMENCVKSHFSVINMDFIAGLPFQRKEDMQENMEIVCQLRPENVTIHTLALKKRAPLFHHDYRHALPTVEETESMVYDSWRLLEKGSYIPYYMYRQTYMAANLANVGYSLPNKISRYNIEMMEERQTILACGPGGATKFRHNDGHSLEKVYMPKEIDRYVEVLPKVMAQRRLLCAKIYRGDDL